MWTPLNYSLWSTAGWLSSSSMRIFVVIVFASQPAAPSARYCFQILLVRSACTAHSGSSLIVLKTGKSYCSVAFCGFDFLCTASQIIGGYFATFCGLLRIYEL